MVKLNVLSIALILLVAAVMIFSISLLFKTKSTITTMKNISATANSSMYKCNTNADCVNAMNKTLKTCMSAVCYYKECKAIPTPNCCGNNITESIENGLPGSKCSCPKDYGVCNSTVKFLDSTNKLTTAKYIIRRCIDNQCQIIYDDSMQRDSEFFNIWYGTGFRINIYVRYSNPFYGDNNILQVEMKLNDYDDQFTQPPIIINEVRLMEGTKILAKINPSTALSSIGQTVTNDIAVNYYDFIYPEEPKSLTFSIDYEYTPLIKKNGVLVQQPVERKTYTVPLTDRVTFLDKSLIPE